MVLRAIRGDTVTYRLTITDQNGLPIDITGATVFFTVKNQPSDDDEDAVISKDITIHEDADAGITNVELTATDTDLEPKSYYYDVQVKLNDVIESVTLDKFQVLQDVTVRTATNEA